MSFSFRFMIPKQNASKVNFGLFVSSYAPSKYISIPAFLFLFFFFAYKNYFRDKFLEGDISIRPQFRKVVFSLGYRKPSLFSSYHNEKRKWNILNNENKLIFSLHLLFTPDFWQISELQIKKKIQYRS